MRTYSESDWEAVGNFIVSQWGSGHPMLVRRLFDWQFRGFGAEGQGGASLLLFVEGELVGFRGIIPGLYQVPSPRGMQVLPGGSLAMWMLREEFRGRGLGRIMHAEAERLFPVLAGAGSNPETSVPIYLKNGFRLLESMERYLAALDPPACQSLFGNRAAELPRAPVSDKEPPIAPSPCDPAILARIWEGSAFEAGFFSLYRNEEFWRWRILESQGFRYEIFLDPEGAGFAVARLEPLLSSEGAFSVLRLIDLVPARPSTWHAVEDLPFARFLGRCLAWSRETGCIAADFHCTTGVFRPTLARVGFVRERDLSGDGVLPLPRLFNGAQGRGRPINALVKAPGIESFERVYMVKSDNDMDRPRRLDADGNVLY
ncbi:MAG: GNAT family N-acetyltransferase [Synergistaceae bacterium]|nr:GNAT family N-acetyltransferase [Synergistaceae bacterium]